MELGLVGLVDVVVWGAFLVPQGALPLVAGGCGRGWYSMGEYGSQGLPDGSVGDGSSKMI